MPKNEMVAYVEKTAERIAKKVLKEYKAVATMGTWIKTLEDENRILKRRVEELEIRVKKLNAYGPTPPTLPRKRKTSPTDAVDGIPSQFRLSPAQLKKIRGDRGLSQPQFAQLLGVPRFRYTKWEHGRLALPDEFDVKIKEIRDLKGTDLRTRLHKAGIFQPNGKPTTAAKKQEVSTASTSCVPKNKTVSAGYRNLTPERMKEIRDTLGLTQRELGALIGVRRNRYGNWERGFTKPTPEYAKKIIALIADKEKNNPIAKEEVAVTKQQNGDARITTIGPIKSGTSFPGKAWLKNARAELGMSQKQLSLILEIKPNRYANWECGFARPAPEFVERIMALLAEKHNENPASKPISEMATTGNVSAKTMAKNTAHSAKKPEGTSKNISSISARLKNIRMELGITQKQIAEQLGIRENRYAKWEGGVR